VIEISNTRESSSKLEGKDGEEEDEDEDEDGEDYDLAGYEAEKDRR
jgi:hypothetical protein